MTRSEASFTLRALVRSGLPDVGEHTVAGEFALRSAESSGRACGLRRMVSYTMIPLSLHLDIVHIIEAALSLSALLGQWGHRSVKYSLAVIASVLLLKWKPFSTSAQAMLSSHMSIAVARFHIFCEWFRCPRRTSLKLEQQGPNVWNLPQHLSVVDHQFKRTTAI